MGTVWNIRGLPDSGANNHGCVQADVLWFCGIHKEGTSGCSCAIQPVLLGSNTQNRIIFLWRTRHPCSSGCIIGESPFCAKYPRVTSHLKHHESITSAANHPTTAYDSTIRTHCHAATHCDSSVTTHCHPQLQTHCHPQLQAQAPWHLQLQAHCHPQLQAHCHPQLQAHCHPQLQTHCHPQLQTHGHPQLQNQTAVSHPTTTSVSSGASLFAAPTYFGCHVQCGSLWQMWQTFAWWCRGQCWCQCWLWLWSLWMWSLVLLVLCWLWSGTGRWACGLVLSTLCQELW